MIMNETGLKHALLDKQRELREQVAALENEAREGTGAEVEDPIDTVVSTEAKAGAFETSTRQRRILTEIDDALRRMQDGSYGKCVDCGKPIEPGRLEAVPWTRYCLEDQQKHDAEQRSPEDVTF
jgi:DnaK suppressor protein